MDFSFHIQQGQKLLAREEASSMKRALEHFKKANEITEEGHVGKPKILYNLALGNYLIGNIELAYKIAHKAKKSIDLAIKNSVISMNNMREMLGEGNIDELINHINEKFPQVLIFVEANDEDFDENVLDFSHVNTLYKSKEKKGIKPNISVKNLPNDVIMATFAGLCRTNDELVYFDKSKGEVLMHVQGYFTSMTDDQSISNRRLVERITNNEATDFVDEDRHILIDRLLLVDFLEEYQNQAKGREPFTSFQDFFSQEILNDFSYNEDLTINDLAFSNHIQDKFHKIFSTRYQSRIPELRDEYSKIFENTCNALAKNWIINKVFNGEELNDIESNELELNFLFKSSDHIRYQNGSQVSGPHGGARRAIKVEPNINGNEGYTVTMFNMDGNHPVWQNNVQMAPKQMKVIEDLDEKIVLRGYGHDIMGSSFADYGLTIFQKDGSITGCTLHMHDRNVDIKYLP